MAAWQMTSLKRQPSLKPMSWRGRSLVGQSSISLLEVQRICCHFKIHSTQAMGFPDNTRAKLYRVAQAETNAYECSA